MSYQLFRSNCSDRENYIQEHLSSISDFEPNSREIQYPRCYSICSGEKSLHLFHLTKSIFKTPITKETLQNIHLKSTKMMCDLCPKIYFSGMGIKKHMRNVHCEKNLGCNFCNYTKRLMNLKVHEKTHVKAECLLVKSMYRSWNVTWKSTDQKFHVQFAK